MAKETTEKTSQAKTAPTTKVQWDDSGITNSYANVCNVSSSREEVVMVFGINKSWERGQNEVQVQLTDRIILSPFAAKRLSTLLTNVLQQYETRFGSLDVTGSSTKQAAVNQ